MTEGVPGGPLDETLGVGRGAVEGASEVLISFPFARLQFQLS